MNDQTSQSFKVEWLNTTLKFLKNDRQMMIKYSDMPIVHVEYFKNIIRQHESDASLGFKSLYAPVWEAMKIFSLKYEFKVSTIKSKDGKTGQLVIQKILKKVNQENKENILQEVECEGKLKPDNNNNGKKIINSPKIDSKNKISETCKNQKSTTPIKDKDFQEKRKIIESISPKYLRTTLQRILNFMDNQIELSLVFNDLAPIEAKFLENFIVIFNMRTRFEALLSPTCIEILDRISVCFKEFDKTYKLEIGAVQTDTNTNKREVTFVKVPENPEPTTPLNLKLNKISNDNQTSIIATEDSSKRKFLKGLIVNIKKNDTNNIQLNKTNNVPANNKCNNNTIYHTETLNNRQYNITENRLCMTINNQGANKSIKNNSTIDKSIEEEKNVNCHIESRTDNTDDFIVINNISINKNNGRMMKMDPINDLNINNNSKLDNLKIRNGYLKGFLKDPIEKTSTPQKPQVTKHTVKSFSKVKSAKERAFPGKTKAIQDMSVPVEIKNALRMMRLMGWQGGALGLRGEGITEPIIPEINRAPGSGLGHVRDKNEIETNQIKLNFRKNVLESILDLLDRNISISDTSYQKELCKKEMSFVRNIILCINKRTILNLPKGTESDLIKKIMDKMNSDLDLCIELDISHHNRKITYTKTFKTMENKPKKKKKKTKPNQKKVKFELIILKDIYQLIKSDDSEITIDFDYVLETKHREVVEKCCLHVNRRHLMLCNNIVNQNFAIDIFRNIGDNYLNIGYSTNLKSLVIRKVGYKDKLNIKKNQKQTDQNNQNVKRDDLKQTKNAINVCKNTKSKVTNNNSAYNNCVYSYPKEV